MIHKNKNIKIDIISQTVINSNKFITAKIDNYDSVYKMVKAHNGFMEKNNNVFINSITNVGQSQEIPVYNKTIRNFTVVILDSYITGVPLLENLSGFNRQCNSHGMYIYEILRTMFPMNNNNLKFLNLAVFNCEGKTSIKTLIDAIKIIIDYKLKNRRERVIVNFSGYTPYTYILNQLFKELSKLNVRIVVCAGNDGRNCDLTSPASASIMTSIETVGSTINNTRASFSNYGNCVSTYLQGCLKLKTRIVCGTSFSTPLQTGRGIVFNSKYKRANVRRIKRGLLRNNKFFV